MCFSPDLARLSDLEDQARASKKGLWSEGGGSQTIRDLKYTIENPRNYVDSLHQKPVNGAMSFFFKAQIFLKMKKRACDTRDIFSLVALASRSIITVCLNGQFF